MFRWFIALTAALVPLVGMACQSADRHECRKQFRQLVAYRAEAIDMAFGDMFGALPSELDVKIFSSRDPEYELYGTRAGYDQKQRTLLFPRRALGSKIPNPLRWASYYWPFYQNEQYRLEFPIIEVIDNVLWNAYLQEAATARGLSWPHKDCAAVDVGRRLPCEMLIKGIAEYVKAPRGPLFNSNRLDRIWPDDFGEFRSRVWRTDQEYLDVQRYGGIMLIRPLIDEFGAPRALAYIAQHPFKVEENSLRVAALRYQEDARERLGGKGLRTQQHAIAADAGWEPGKVHIKRATGVIANAAPSPD